MISFIDPTVREVATTDLALSGRSYSSVGERTCAAEAYMVMAQEWADKAQAARMRCATARLRGKLKLAGRIHAEHVDLLERATRYFRKAQDVRNTPIRSAI